MRTIHTALGEMKYDEAGAGPPLVLVHGFPLDSRVWADCVPILAPSSRVITVDLPGFGQSTVKGPFTMNDLADALVTLLDELKIEKAAFAGLSMGGYVIQALVRKAPQRVSRLIFVDTRINADDATARAGRDKMITLAQQIGTSGVVEQMLPKMLHPDAYTKRPDIVSKQRAIMMDCPAQTIEYACAAMRDRDDFTPQLSKLPCPLTVIVGEGDVIAPPELAKAMHAAAMESGQGSTLRVIANAGHMAPIEQPEATATAMMI